jgi:PII-like signaling protein
MNTGYQITFYTQGDRFHHEHYITEFLLSEAKAEGIRGATVIHGAQGVGHDGRRHAAGFWENSDAPVMVTMVCAGDEVRRLLARLREHKVKVFFTRIAVEYETLGVD